MKENKLRFHLDNDLPLVSTRLWSTNAFFWEAVGQTGKFDYVEFLAEYSPFDYTDLPNMVRAAELNHMGSMIKLDFQGRGYAAQKAVQAGFQSILFVDHTNPDQVRESVRLVRPKMPEGTGEFGYPNGRYIGGQSHIPVQDHIKRLNDLVLCFMIEKEEAVNHIDEICSVPGVDMIQFGPNDYCMSRGWNRADHAGEVRAAERKCIETALAHGVRPRCEIHSAKEAEYYAELGVKDFALGDQLAVLKAYWNNEGTEIRGMISDRYMGRERNSDQ